MSKKKKQDVSSTMTIQELASSMDTGYVDHLETKLTQLGMELHTAKKNNEELCNKIKHLEELLVSSSEVTSPKIILTPEEMIADFQIQRLLEVARERTLTLDETRQYDLFVKNKRLSANDPTVIEGQASRITNIKDVKQLANIAKLKLE